MKTLFRTYDAQDARRLAQRREVHFGVRFDHYHTGAGWIVAPVCSPREYESDPVLADKLAPHVQAPYEGSSALALLAERSGLSLRDTAVAAVTLVRQGKAIPIVNRNGNMAGIYRPILTLTGATP